MAKEYDISRASGCCAACDKPLAAGEDYTATVREIGEELGREDYCLDCWPQHEESQTEHVLAVWRTRVPQPQEKKKLFIDNELLIHFFERLNGADEPVKISFRYVLALVLMRKKLLVYDRMQREDDGGEIWQMHFKGSDQVHHVIDPKLDEDKIAEVSGQLGQILEGEL